MFLLNVRIITENDTQVIDAILHVIQFWCQILHAYIPWWTCDTIPSERIQIHFLRSRLRFLTLILGPFRHDGRLTINDISHRLINPRVRNILLALFQLILFVSPREFLDLGRRFLVWAFALGSLGELTALALEVRTCLREKVAMVFYFVQFKHHLLLLVNFITLFDFRNVSESFCGLHIHDCRLF